MISAKELNLKRSKTGGRTFLKYQHIPFGTRELRTRAIDVRATPQLNSPAAIDIARDVTCDGKPHTVDADSIPLNLTNLKILSDKVGDDITAARGMILVWSFSLKNNPNARPGDDSEVMGLDLLDALLPEPAAEPRPAAPIAPGSRRRG